MEKMFDLLRGFLEAGGHDPGGAHFALLGLAATLEYLFPPFPGDVVVLFGAFLVGRYDWSVASVLVAVNVGSVIGLSIDYGFGVWVARHDARWREKYPRWRRLGASIDRFDASYRRWGLLCIAVNRFLPAIRAIFFVAAGMAGIRYWKVLLLGTLSSLAWNVLLLMAGAALGHNWESLRELLRTYSAVAWAVALGVGALLLVAYFRRDTGNASGTS